MVAFFSLFFDIAIHFALLVKTRLVRPKFKRAGNTSARVKFAGYSTRRDARVGPSSLDHFGRATRVRCPEFRERACSYPAFFKVSLPQQVLF